MNNRHRKTLKKVFTDPVSGTIEWAAVEAMLVAAGCVVIEGEGSRVRFSYVAEGEEDRIATFHRPHPAKEAKRYQIKDARDFLTQIGLAPAEASDEAEDDTDKEAGTSEETVR
ncbi:HicA toxin of toxin-antitoxin [Methylobacterium phyllostachyos]|uniref:HicA toxin of toxin-antitoxin n=1 Tax=Methylobacterium phyllostachyos TaxID=582672 RepID=A0A1H0K7C8_9HYPH|nr:type II toxin-antitoxin system HicA family toxin [Methylobacterium phyllostachyos]SDO51692.1 HicA toxin of toxin-antitoxin [Methylobacterium phyllostachyos]